MKYQKPNHMWGKVWNTDELKLYQSVLHYRTKTTLIVLHYLLQLQNYSTVHRQAYNGADPPYTNCHPIMYCIWDVAHKSWLTEMEGKRKDSKYNNKNQERYFEKIMSSLNFEGWRQCSVDGE